jgi:hypothetical protein
MEAACESGRRAANAILADEQLKPDAAVFPLDEPFPALRARDEQRFARHQPWSNPLSGIFYYVPAWLAAVGLRALFLLCLMSAGTLVVGTLAAAGAGVVAWRFPAVWSGLFRAACAFMSVGGGVHAPLLCESPATPPDAAAVSVFCFGLYALIFGVSLTTLPRPVLDRLGFPRRQGPWMAVVGGAPVLIGVMYLLAALFEVRPFFWITVFARAAVFLICLRLRYRRHAVSGLLMAAALPDLSGAFWTAWTLADTRAQAVGLILGITNLIVATALYLFPTETRWKLGFEKDAGNWLPLAAVLIAFWGFYEVVAAGLGWMGLVFAAVLCRALFGTLCIVASLLHGVRPGAVESPWRLKLAGLGFWATAALLYWSLGSGG